ncbi:MAG TPA: L-serine ammonia-lyase, iron-sulfur-dependent, subunit alpha [Bacilli bacterium]|nr:L-serine ammonia-lyase, iron-sulfur-dependent, subunit alpha [Bacilli bacterium]HQA55841.1 L-serine ammonia-lyase, iron-sulfur-dependent, subunit alpha [Bacilli bacterium]
MRSIREIFITGYGPSSSHTMGPVFAAQYILKKYPDPKYVKVTLYGSLALTGKGHLTDYALDQQLKFVPHEIVFDCETPAKHPNTMLFTITKEDGKIENETILSIGGGTIVTRDNAYDFVGYEIYPEHNLKEVILYCKKNHISLEEYVIRHEGEDILTYLDNVYQTMENARLRGISTSGKLPGSLGVERKAREMFMNMRKAKDGKTNIHMNVAIASFAVAEENAAGGLIVIAPTCGSAGVIPGAITYLKMKDYSRRQIVRGLLVAGLIGIIAKTNASISGAECGCQAEIGVACAMAAAMLADVQDIGIDNVAQAAEIAMEHSLGLTCDPIDGYVQIPCIERCAIFALKAINAATLAKLIPAMEAKVSFDQSLATMYSTGLDLKEGYRETSLSGLAKLVK